MKTKTPITAIRISAHHVGFMPLSRRRGVFMRA
jgi:hypothetical protein